MPFHARLKSQLRCGAVIVYFALPQHAGAQTQDLTKVPADETMPAETPAPVAAPMQGFTLGPFAIDATAAIGEMYSDNIFVAKNNAQGDWISTLSYGLTAALTDGDNRLNLRTGGNFGRYARFSSENYDDFYAGADGRLRIDQVMSLFGGATYDWTHESRESPDAVNGIEPTRYRAGDYYAGIVLSFSDFVVRAGGTIDTYAYDNVRSSSGIIDNKDRSRTQYQVGGRISYRLSTAVQPFVQAYWDSRDYDRSPDDFGYMRSSSGYRAAAGVSSTLSSTLNGEVYAGIIGQNYDDPRFSDLTKADFGTRLTWRPLAGTVVRGFVDRTVEETTLLGAPSFLRTGLGASLEQEVRPDLYLNGHFYHTENDYQDVDRIDHVSDAGLGLRYFFIPNIYAGVDYVFLHRASNSALADFYENRVWFRLGAQLAPAYRSDPAGFAPFRDDTAPGGFYVGLLAGDGTLISALDGPRGSDGSLIADFGNNGWQGDIAAGYGTLIGRIYVGIEADAAAASQNWLHTGDGGTRIFSVRKLDSYEVAARLGYELENHAILYGRFGAVATQFATPYQQGNHYVRETGYQSGLRFGGGIEFPLSGRLFGRMEYTQTSYADYDVMPNRTADNFANNENLMRFGAVYHIGGAPADTQAPAFDYHGFYAGLQGGFGSLISYNAGNRNPPQTLQVQRAGPGADGGIFAGYAVTAGALFLGAEADAEVSNADWNIKRDPTGRIYSVAKDYTLGASLLAGYIVNGNTLIYGRLGIADTRFDNKYSDEGGINTVTPSVTRNGLRYGGGVEMPVGEDTFIRFDYTWTRYGSHNVDYVTGIDYFRNSENLFRIGVALKI